MKIESAKQLGDLETPALILDVERLERNLRRLRTHLQDLGVALRPHVKTVKSIEIVRRALEGQPGGITVSTLKEAEYFLDNGIRDILYAVGIAPGKLRHAAALTRRGAALILIVDNLMAARVLSEIAVAEQVRFSVLIELDVDGHRAGVRPDSELLVALGRALRADSAVELRGVMTHAGESYNCRSIDALREMAERERSGAVHAA